MAGGAATTAESLGGALAGALAGTLTGASPTGGAAATPARSATQAIVRARIWSSGATTRATVGGATPKASKAGRKVHKVAATKATNRMTANNQTPHRERRGDDATSSAPVVSLSASVKLSKSARG